MTRRQPDERSSMKLTLNAMLADLRRLGVLTEVDHGKGTPMTTALRSDIANETNGTAILAGQSVAADEVVDRGFTENGVTVTHRRVTEMTCTTEAKVVEGDDTLRLVIGPRSNPAMPWGFGGTGIDLTADAALSLAARLSDGALKLREKGR